MQRKNYEPEPSTSDKHYRVAFPMMQLKNPGLQISKSINDSISLHFLVVHRSV